MATGSPKIYSAMSAIMGTIGPVQKSQKNAFQGYMFRGIDQFLVAFHPCCVKHGVFTVPRVIEERSEIRETHKYEKGQKIGVAVSKHVHVMVEYDFIATDGSSLKIGPIPGEGIDTSDKATNKAMTSAQKNMLIHTFNIPTEDQADGDRDYIPLAMDKKEEQKKQAEKKQPATQEPPWQNTAPEKKQEVSQEQLKRMFAIAADQGWTSEMVDAFFKTHPKLMLQSLKDMTRKQYDHFCDVYLPLNAIEKKTEEPPKTLSKLPGDQIIVASGVFGDIAGKKIKDVPRELLKEYLTWIKKEVGGKTTPKGITQLLSMKRDISLYLGV